MTTGSKKARAGTRKKRSKKVSKRRPTDEQKCKAALRVIELLQARKVDLSLVNTDKDIYIIEDRIRYHPLTDEYYQDVFGDAIACLTQLKAKHDRERREGKPVTPKVTALAAIIAAFKKRYPNVKGISATSIDYALTHSWPSWGKATEHVKVAYYQAALDTLCNDYTEGYSFSLNLSYDLVREIRGKPEKGFADQVRRKIEQSLRRALGRKKPFWFVVEADRKGRIHLHGSVYAKEEELPAAAAVLRNRSEITTSAKTKALKTSQFLMAILMSKTWKDLGHTQGTVRWAMYVVKDSKRTRRMVIGSLASQSGLMPLARKLYEADAAVHERNRAKIYWPTLKAMFPGRREKKKSAAV